MDKYSVKPFASTLRGAPGRGHLLLIWLALIGLLIGTVGPVHPATSAVAAPAASNATTATPEELSDAEWASIQAQIGQDQPELMAVHATEDTKLVASGSPYDKFGHAVDIDGNTLVVGAPYVDAGASSNQGAVYVFKRNVDGTWSQQQKLIASDGKKWDYFGYAVALDGDTAIVGASEADVNGNVDPGATFVYTLTYAPEVLSIARANASPTGASTVAYTVTLDLPVSGVSANNFALMTGGNVNGASITNVSGSGATWRVEVNTGTGNGTLRLDLTSTDGITPPITNVPFTGEEYTIDRALPDDPNDPNNGVVYLPFIMR